MLQAAVAPSLLSAALVDGGVVIAPNQRLAQALRASWAAQQSAKVWPAPAIYALDEWIAQCWQQWCERHPAQAEHLQPLHPVLARRLWQRAIGDCQPELDAGRYANLASEAHQLLERWQLTPAQLPLHRAASEQFAGWSQRFSALLDEIGSATAEQQQQQLIDWLTANPTEQRRKLTLCGFQSLPPLRSALLAAAFASHNELPLGDPSHCQPALLVRPSDPANELYAAIDAALAQIAAAPDTVAAVVISDLSQRLSEVERVAQRLVEHYQLPADTVNLSASRPLAEQPIIAIATMLLRGFSQPLPLADCLHLLYSPYWLAGAASSAELATAELTLRASGQSQLRLSELLAALSDASTAPAEESPEAPNSAHSALIWLREQWRGNRSLRDWAAVIHAGLTAFGLAGQRSLDSAEYQQLRQWQLALEELAALRPPVAVGGCVVDANAAVSYLAELLAQRPFQPQAGAPRLHLLGTLEAAGLRFDQLHWLGLSSQVLPAALSPNPLLSLEWQRSHAMPRSDHAREQQIGEQLLATLRGCSAQMTVSCALSAGEELLEPSPLLAAIGTQPQPAAVQSPPWLQWTARASEPLDDQRAPALSADEQLLSNGSQLLKQQASMPFNAFLTQRLAAVALQQPAVGVGPALRGSLLHRALEKLLPVGTSSQALAELAADPAALGAAINSAAAAAIEHKKRNNPPLRRDSVASCEQRALAQLLERWVSFDLGRAAFTIEAVEERVTTQIGELTLSLSIDRIDRIDGHQLVIDYKTGKVTKSSWQGERLSDPQLPLYSAALAVPPDGCSFAVVRGDSAALTGEAGPPLLDKTGLGDDGWQQQLANWRLQLQSLADEFCSGDASLVVYNKTEEGYQADLRRINRSPEWQQLAESSEVLS